jgi:dCTP deaminase
MGEKPMFLGSTEIKENQKRIFIKGTFDEEHVRQSSYDLRLGEQAYIVGERAPRRLDEKRPYLVLTPGQFAILTCHEKLSLPREIMGFITLRNPYKMQGLVNVSGFHVDPTFHEQLVFAVQNVGATDIRLKFKEPTFTIFFAKVAGNTDDNVREATPRQGITLQDIAQLGGSTITLGKLKEELDQLRRIVLIYGPVLVAAAVALIVALLKK